MPNAKRRAATTARRIRALLIAVSLAALSAGTAYAAGEGAIATVRAGRHPGFQRLVIDWPGPVTPEAQRQGQVLRVALPGQARLDLTSMPAAHDGPILGVQALREPNSAVLVLLLGPNADYRLTTLPDHRVVIDVTAVGATTKPAARAQPESPSRPAPTIGQQPASAAESRPPAASVAAVPAVAVATRPVMARPAVASVAKPAASALTQPTAAPTDMQRELYRRDLMIASLLQRVERLEQASPLPERPLDEVVAGGAPAAPEPAPAAGTTTVAAVAPAAPGAAPADPPAETPSQSLQPSERVLARTGTLLLRPGEMEVEPELAFTHAEDGAPVFVSNGGAAFFIGEDHVRRNALQASLTARAGLPFDSQVELSLPYNYVDQSKVTKLGDGAAAENDGHGSGFGDLTLTAAKTLTRQRGWLPDLILRAWWDTRTGETRDNDVVIGDGFDEIGAAISALQRQDPLAFFATVGYETTLERHHVDPGDQYRLSLGAALAVSPETSLRFSFDQRFVDDTGLRGKTVNGSDRTIALLTLEAATLLSRGILLDVGVDIGLTDDAPDYTARVSLPIRFNLPVL